MYVCVCHAVTDRQINAAVRDGVRSMRDLCRELDFCRSCGKCGPAVRGLLAEAAPACPAEAAGPAAGLHETSVAC